MSSAPLTPYRRHLSNEPLYAKKDYTATLPFEVLERIFARIPDVQPSSMPAWARDDLSGGFTLSDWMNDCYQGCTQAIREAVNPLNVAGEEGSCPADPNWLPVTLVCKRWRAVALTQFGRTVPIPVNTGALAMNAVLSGFAPLRTSLHVDEIRHSRNSPAWEDARALLRNDLSRLRRLDVSLAGSACADEYAEADLAHRALLDACNAAGIQELRAVGADPKYHVFGSVIITRSGAPRKVVIPSSSLSTLRRILLRRCVFADFSMLRSCHRLTSLTLDQSQDLWPNTASMLDTLSSLSYLQDLHLSDKTWPHDIAAERCREPVDLTSLRRLRLVGTIDQIVPFLSSVSIHPSATLLLSCHVLPWTWGGHAVDADALPLAKVISAHFSSSKASGDVFSRVTIDLSETEQNIVCTELGDSSKALSSSTAFALSIHRDWLSLKESGPGTTEDAFAAIYAALPVVDDRSGAATSVALGISSCPGLRNHDADAHLKRGLHWWPFVARRHGLRRLKLSPDTALPVARQLALAGAQVLPQLSNIEVDMDGVRKCDVPQVEEALATIAETRRSTRPVRISTS